MSELERLHQAAIQVICEQDQRIQQLQAKVRYYQRQDQKNEQIMDQIQSLNRQLSLKDSLILQLQSQLEISHSAVRQLRQSMIFVSHQDSYSFRTHNSEQDHSRQHQKDMEKQIEDLQMTVRYLENKIRGLAFKDNSLQGKCKSVMRQDQQVSACIKLTEKSQTFNDCKTLRTIIKGNPKLFSLKDLIDQYNQRKQTTQQDDQESTVPPNLVQENQISAFTKQPISRWPLLVVGIGIGSIGSWLALTLSKKN